MRRLKFESGVRTLRNVASVPAIVLYGGMIAIAALDVESRRYWPLVPSTHDTAVWLLAFITLAFPPISALVWLPFGVVTSIVRRFVVDENDGVADAEWNAMRLHNLVVELTGYATRLLIWVALAAMLLLLDWSGRVAAAPAVSLHAVVAHYALIAVLVLAYALGRLFAVTFVSEPVSDWLSKRIEQTLVAGVGERCYQFALKIHERNSFGIERLLGFGRPQARSSAPERLHVVEPAERE